jgi:hypothetical protein
MLLVLLTVACTSISLVSPGTVCCTASGSALRRSAGAPGDGGCVVLPGHIDSPGLASSLSWIKIISRTHNPLVGGSSPLRPTVLTVDPHGPAGPSDPISWARLSSRTGSRNRASSWVKRAPPSRSTATSSGRMRRLRGVWDFPSYNSGMRQARVEALTGRDQPLAAATSCLWLPVISSMTFASRWVLHIALKPTAAACSAETGRRSSVRSSSAPWWGSKSA